MYVSGFFYGAISVSQAYIDALSRFVAEHHKVKVGKDVPERCHRLRKHLLISEKALRAALGVFDERHDFHHLNRDVEQDFQKLQARALACMNSLYVVESELFAYSVSDAEPGTLVLAKPDYWPSAGPGLAQVHLRNLW